MLTLRNLFAAALLSGLAPFYAGCEETAQAQSPQRDPHQKNMALSCYTHAREQTLLGEGNAFLLCRGSSSPAPVQCYELADDETPLPRRLLFDLCRCADSTAPVQCFERGSRETFLTNQRIVQLCSPIVVQNLTLNCSPISYPVSRQP